MSTVKTVVVMVEKWKGHSRQPQVGDLTSGLTSVSIVAKYVFLYSYFYVLMCISV